MLVLYFLHCFTNKLLENVLLSTPVDSGFNLFFTKIIIN